MPGAIFSIIYHLLYKKRGTELCASCEMNAVSSFRADPQHRGPAAHSETDLPEQEEEILGSDDDEQEDPNDYCKGKNLPV